MNKLMLFLAIVLITDSPPVQFTVPEITIPSGTTVELPVVIETNGNDVGSLEFALNYDQSILQFTDIIISEDAQRWLTYTMDTGSGKVRWGGYDQTFGNHNFTQPTELFKVIFTVLDQDWSVTPITVGRKTAGTDLGWDLEVLNTDGYINYDRTTYDNRDEILGKAYPVPTLGKVTVELTIPTAGLYQIRTVDLRGRIISQRQQTFFQGYVTVQEDLGSLPQGLYLLQVNNNRFTKSFKLIKE